jgi:sensor histidine kinase regulating citrate/malate metabolism
MIVIRAVSVKTLLAHFVRKRAVHAFIVMRGPVVEHPDPDQKRRQHHEKSKEALVAGHGKVSWGEFMRPMRSVRPINPLQQRWKIGMVLTGAAFGW